MSCGQGSARAKKPANSLALSDKNPIRFGALRLAGGVSGLHRHFAEADGSQHHGKLVSVVPPQPMRAQLSLHQEAVFKDLVAHPNVLHLFDPIGLCGLMDKAGGPIRGAHPGAPQPPLPLDSKVAPGHRQGDEEFSARFEMPIKSVVTPRTLRHARLESGMSKSE